MNRRITLALSGAILALAVAGVPAVAMAAGSPAITIRIEGKKKTLLLPTLAHGHAGFITRFNAPPTGCPAQSAMGAFDTLTSHDWVGSWFASPPDSSVSAILGERYAKSKTNFWKTSVTT